MPDTWDSCMTSSQASFISSSKSAGAGTGSRADLLGWGVGSTDASAAVVQAVAQTQLSPPPRPLQECDTRSRPTRRPVGGVRARIVKTAVAHAALMSPLSRVRRIDWADETVGEGAGNECRRLPITSLSLFLSVCPSPAPGSLSSPSMSSELSFGLPRRPPACRPGLASAHIPPPASSKDARPTLSACRFEDRSSPGVPDF
eukprot:CAMPEP_0117661194 /NCGR_PEP_ID=MMETSP0804-20121206/7410_1 /TAXON_ID=1074897 /ORGANISM="Tetraselmis astigmatica, Strain CCMP880" /LENGTH=200 /DNA_ID=CAMNT_0005468051 /DNA_START=1149 /DNA_END=1753 /DNA_ORIENTATION=+